MTSMMGQVKMTMEAPSRERQVETSPLKAREINSLITYKVTLKQLVVEVRQSGKCKAIIY